MGLNNEIASHAIQGPIADIYQFAKSSVMAKVNLEKLKSASSEAIFKRIDRVSKVKTIWQIDKAVDIRDFYYPTKLEIENKTIPINSVLEIPNFIGTGRDNSNCVHIEGKVGLGKSTFLRYLCIQELERGHFFPLFLRLSDINENGLIELLQVELEIFGFKINDEIFDVLLRSGKLLLLLDGFDEIHEKFQKSVIRDLEKIAQKYKDSIHILVSGRPESEVKFLSEFNVHHMATIDFSDFGFILSRSMNDPEIAHTIVKKLENNRHKIASFIDTPLLLALLALVYKATKEIPDTFLKFYENLFDTLMKRHDATKPGFKRDTRCQNFEYSDYLNCFELYSYKSYKIGLNLELSNANRIMQSAIDRFSLIEKSDNVLIDISNISNLIQQEGLEYRFIHRSVQEYFSASFIKRRSVFSVDFYRSLANGTRDKEKWRGVITYLEVIDEYRCHKYFLIPDLINSIEMKGFSPNSLITKLTKDDESRLSKGLYTIPFGEPTLKISHSFKHNSHDFVVQNKPKENESASMRRTRRMTLFHYLEKMIADEYRLLHEFEEKLNREESFTDVDADEDFQL